MQYYSNTIFNQLLAFLPKSKFSQFIRQHDGDKWVKSLTTWNQLVALLYAQATGKDSLREIETGLSMHPALWYHLGVKTIARSSLSHANNRRDYRIFEKLFYELLQRCRQVTPENNFSFNNPLYTLDATTIKLCLSMFDWARYTKIKGALKLHSLLDNRTAIPELVVVTDGKTGDITAGKEHMMLDTLQKGSVVVFDRAYIDYSWWFKLDKSGVFFVSRVKKNQFIDFVGQHKEPLEAGILADDYVLIGEYYGMKTYPEKLRRVRFYNKERGKEYTYLTNNFELSALQIVEIYKARWRVEIFFKWIKQNLKIKTFLGTSRNAVLSQIWVAMIYYLLLFYIKFQTKFTKSLLELTRMIRETLLIRRSLIDLLSLSTRTLNRFIARDGPQLELF